MNASMTEDPERQERDARVGTMPATPKYWLTEGTAEAFCRLTEAGLTVRLFRDWEGLWASYVVGPDSEAPVFLPEEKTSSFAEALAAANELCEAMANVELGADVMAGYGR